MSEFLRLWGFIILVAVILIGLSIWLMKKFKAHPMTKYMPTLAIWMLSIILFIYGRFFAESMQDLGYYVMSMITGLATFIVMIATLVIDNLRNRRRIK
jgi:predicted tellurium resistance membrane protein TerC